MDWNQVEGNWEMLKGKIKKNWGKFTDDDITYINGKKQELLGRLQEKYGFTKDRAEKEVEGFVKKYGDKNCSTDNKGSCSI